MKKEIITKNKNLLIIAVLIVTASLITGILQEASAQTQSSTGAFTLRNLTGSVQVFPSKSQIIQTKASVMPKLNIKQYNDKIRHCVQDRCKYLDISIN